MSELVHCKTCNHQVSTTAEFCPNCGEVYPGASNQELEIHNQAEITPQLGCLPSIYAILLGTLIVVLLELIGINIGPFSPLFIVTFALAVIIINRFYISNKQNSQKSNKEVVDKDNKNKKGVFLGCLVAPLIFFIVAPLFSFLFKSTGLLFDEIVVIPVIALIIVLIIKVFPRRS